MINLRQISLSQGNKILLKDCSFSLFEKQKIGLIGANGCGKSTLFSVLLGKMSVDKGDFSHIPGLRISHLAQEIPETEEPAIQYVLAADQEYWQIQQSLAKAEKEHDDPAILHCHERLLQIGGYSRPAQAASILAGLGIAQEKQQKAVQVFSGGFRMRLNLARCLIKPADLLLLDEPTNHLDMEALFWLEKWLQQSPSSMVVISHDRDFLDAFTTHTVHIEHQNMKLYTGNYSQFEKSRAQELQLQQTLYTKQQDKIQHMLRYVQRFRAKASKAAQAQSRLRALEKMELVAKAQYDSPFSFQFYAATASNVPLLECQELNLGYAENLILSNVQIRVKLGDRIGLLGPNGQGKSTFIKTLQGDLVPLRGSIQRSPHLRIGYYAQHQLEELDANASPIETLQALSYETKEQTIRDFLGGFDFQNDMATSKIRYFSGGEKARLALAKLIFQKPNLLLLDEPTNHLDIGMRAALEIALQSYEGAVILISHDRHLLKSCVEDYYLVYQKKLTTFDGDIDDYAKWLTQKPAEQSKTAPSSSKYKEHKNLHNRLKKLEEEMQQEQQCLWKVEEALSDGTLYEDHAQTQLKVLQTKQATLQKSLLAKEEEWLALMEHSDTDGFQ